MPPGNPSPSTYSGEIHLVCHVNRGNVNPTQWILPTRIIGPFPVFDADLFQNWRIEVKLRQPSQVGANAAQLISEIATTFPMNSRMGIPTYVGSTENSPQLRQVGHVVEMMNRRSAKRIRRLPGLGYRLLRIPDGAWGANFKDSRARFERCFTRFNERGLAVIGSVVLRREIQALRIPDG